MPQTGGIKEREVKKTWEPVYISEKCRECQDPLVEVFVRETEYPDERKIGKTIVVGWLCLKCRNFTSTLSLAKRLTLCWRTATTQPGSVLRRFLYGCWWVTKLTLKICLGNHPKA